MPTYLHPECYELFAHAPSAETIAALFSHELCDALARHRATGQPLPTWATPAVMAYIEPVAGVSEQPPPLDFGTWRREHLGKGLHVTVPAVHGKPLPKR